MAISVKSVICVALFLLLLSLHGESSAVEKKAYIVYLGSHYHGRDAAPEVHAAVEKSHYEFLSNYLGSYEKAKDAIFYSYQKHINGFAAVLSDDEAAQIRKNPNVISVFLNGMNKIQTTNSWKFMGLEHKSGAVPHNSLWRKSNFGEDVIIGHIDTGVWPESKSFSDEGYGPIPSRWKGVCQNNTASPFSCNRKLIGASYFHKDYLQTSSDIDPSMMSPRDFEGHGTHTLSTAGGNFVSGVDFLGLARGTVKGGAPRARLATYKVCWGIHGCSDADIIAAFDAAIHDGVDIISISIAKMGFSIVGPPLAFPYYDDGIAIGSFHAVKHGITVVAGAGNEGPTSQTVKNIAPWLLTVGASTQDREISNYLKVLQTSRDDGDQLNKWFKGESFSEPFPDNGTLYPLITGEQAAIQSNNSKEASACSRGTLHPEMVKDKILICRMGLDDVGRYAADMGAAGLVYYTPKSIGDDLFPQPYLLPAVQISYDDGIQLLALINTTTNAITLGSITAPSTKYNVRPAPFVAAFSSRGPNKNSPTILKPDIIAPGVDILAAYSEAAPLSDYDPSDNRRVPYMLMSGTSMATPHASGVVALLKSIHPDWSPAAIRSAIMTTATTVDNRHKRILDQDSHEAANPLAYGAGHISANHADDPGLVYDVSTKEYLYLLCAEGYTTQQLKTLFLEDGEEFKCINSTGPVDINYPSIMVPNLNKTITLTRRVKNVGSPGTYRALVNPPNGVRVAVTPNVLSFEGIGEEKEFTVTIDQVIETDDSKSTHDYAFGEMAWSDGKHFVKSPIVVRFT